MSATPSNNSESVVLNLGSTLTIDDIADKNKQYQEAVKADTPVKLEADTIENIDLSGIQFLLYLNKSISNQDFLSHIKFADSVIELINKSGFANFLRNE